MADFRIAVEQAQGGICDCDSRPAGPAVGEQELAILVVGASGTSLHVYLVIVVLAGAFPKSTELQGVIFLYPGEAVGYVIDGTRGVRRIWPAAQPREDGQIHCWDAVRKQFPLREYVWIAEAARHCCLGARFGSIKEVRRVDGYQHDVLASAEQSP